MSIMLGCFAKRNVLFDGWLSNEAKYYTGCLGLVGIVLVFCKGIYVMLISLMLESLDVLQKSVFLWV